MMSDTPPPVPKRRWWLRALLIIGLISFLMMGTFAGLLIHWSEIGSADEVAANTAFADALQLAGGGPAYLEIVDDDGLRVHHELEGKEPARLRGLHVLAWDARRERLARVDFPGWFVRVKMRTSIGIESFAEDAGLAWRGGHPISAKDLALRGHGLVLDHHFENGGRLLVWSEAEPSP